METAIRPAWKEYKQGFQVLDTLRYYGNGYQTRIENMRQALKTEVLRNYWPRSGRYCEARFSYRYEATEKGVRHALKAEMLNTC